MDRRARPVPVDGGVSARAGLPGEPLVWIALLAIWLVSAALCGLVLALIARKVHPSLSFLRLWIFYAALTGFLVAVVFAVGVF